MMIRSGPDIATSWDQCGTEVIADLAIKKFGENASDLKQ